MRPGPTPSPAPPKTREEIHCENKCCYKGFNLRYWNNEGKCKCEGLGQKTKDAHVCNR